jgi:methionine-rich copper-binding protein CopC
VGAVVRTAPTRVQIWFDGEIEPAFSTLSVTDAAGTRVDRVTRGSMARTAGYSG